MKTNSPTRTLGIDLGDRKHSVCVLGIDGKILGESTIVNTREAMTRLSKKNPGALVVMEFRGSGIDRSGRDVPRTGRGREGPSVRIKTESYVSPPDQLRGLPPLDPAEPCRFDPMARPPNPLPGGFSPPVPQGSGGRSPNPNCREEMLK